VSDDVKRDQPTQGGVGRPAPGSLGEPLDIAKPHRSPRRPSPAKVDDLIGRMSATLAEVREATEQLHPERASSSRNAITMASVMIDEIRLRAHAPPDRRARPVRRLGVGWHGTPDPLTAGGRARTRRFPRPIRGLVRCGVI
jgi:hypothetical protein